MTFTAQPAGSAEADVVLEVSIDGARPATGQVLCLLFDTPEHFPEGRAVEARVEDIRPDGSATCRFELPRPRRVAVSIAHDANRNGRLDRNLLGIPVERYGFTFTRGHLFAPPSFDVASRELASGTTRVDVTLERLLDDGS